MCFKENHIAYSDPAVLYEFIVPTLESWRREFLHMLCMSFLGLVIFCSVTLSICVYVHVELLHIFFRELAQLLTDRWHILCSMLLFAFNMLNLSQIPF